MKRLSVDVYMGYDACKHQSIRMYIDVEKIHLRYPSYLAFEDNPPKGEASCELSPYQKRRIEKELTRYLGHPVLELPEDYAQKHNVWVHARPI